MHFWGLSDKFAVKFNYGHLFHDAAFDILHWNIAHTSYYVHHIFTFMPLFRKALRHPIMTWFIKSTETFDFLNFFGACIHMSGRRRIKIITYLAHYAQTNCIWAGDNYACNNYMLYQDFQILILDVFNRNRYKNK